MLCLAEPFEWAETTGLNVKLCLCVWEHTHTKLHFLVDMRMIDSSHRFRKATDPHFKENLLCERNQS